MGRGGGRSGGGGFSSGGSRGFSSHRSSSPSRSSTSFGSSSSRSRTSMNSSMHRVGSSSHTSAPKPVSSPPRPRPVTPIRPVVPPPRPTYVPPRTIIINNDSPTRKESYYERISPENRKQKVSSYGSGPISSASSIKSGWLPGWYKWICILMATMAVILLVFAGIANGQAKNNVPREKLPASACISTDQWIDDQAKWLSDLGTVKESMQYFYKKTGIQPYLLICNSLNGKGGEITDEEAKDALMTKYNSLYEDEGHMIFGFMEYEDSQYITWIYTGRSADAVMDEAAREIFLNNADRYYTDSSLSDDQYFAKIFQKSADEIMKDYSGNAAAARTYVVLSIVILIGLVGGLFLFHRKEQKIREMEHMKEILNMPVSQSPELKDLENKYGTGK